jgi:hypothetical protein
MSKNTNLSFLTDFLTADIVNSRVGMNNVSPQSTFDVTGSNSGSLPLLNLVASGTGTFQRGVRLLNSGMNAGDHIMMAVGQADGARNMGQFYFQYNELKEVLPNYVVRKKDELNEDGSIKPQSVDYSKLVPILVKAIQELKSEIEILKQ